MDNISIFQQKNLFQSIAIPSTSFSDEFNFQFIQSFFSYKRLSSTSKFFDVSEFSESNESSDDFFSSTEIEGPEYISNDQTKMWRVEIGKQLQHALKIAVLATTKNEEKQLYRKIAMYRNFIKLKYFEVLEQYPEIIVELIRDEIIKAANDTSHLNCIGDVDNFFFSCSFSSISTDLIFVFGSFPLKKLTMLFETKRFSKILIAVRKDSSFRQIADVYEVNKQIIKNRIFEKRFMIEYQKNATLFSAKEKAAFFRFVNHFVALGFPFKRSMLKKKAVLLFRKKNVDHISDVN